MFPGSERPERVPEPAIVCVWLRTPKLASMIGGVASGDPRSVTTYREYREFTKSVGRLPPGQRKDALRRSGIDGSPYMYRVILWSSISCLVFWVLSVLLITEGLTFLGACYTVAAAGNTAAVLVRLRRRRGAATTT
jgi:hypothetical protein